MRSLLRGRPTRDTPTEFRSGREDHSGELAAVSAIHAREHDPSLEGRPLLEDAGEYRNRRGPHAPPYPPEPFNEDTEKYGNQTTLTKTPDGGFIPQGYVGGFPFANPMAGDKAEAGAKMYYNNYYRPAPVVEEAPNCSDTLDKYANFTRTADSNIVFYNSPT